MKKKLLLVALALISTTALADSYDVLKRYKVLGDKLKTQEMLRPLGHDFLFDINATMNTNLFDFMDDVEKVSKKTGTTTDKVNSAIETLEKYNNTEQTLRLNTNIGVPLPTFKAFGIKIVPDFRLSADLGANLGIRTETLSLSDIIKLIGQDAPAEIKTAAASLSDSDVTAIQATTDRDIVAYMIAQPGNGVTEANAGSYRDKYFIPSSLTGPNIHFFSKLDVKAGLLFNYFVDRWFGHLHLYGMHRTDYLLRLTVENVARSDSFTDVVKELNSQVLLMTDYKLGHKFKNGIKLYGSIEELKLARISDNIAEGGDLNFGTDPLFRLHADKVFKLVGLNLRPFTGLHSRSGYDLTDGLYAGTDVGFFVWKERIGVRLRGMMDNEHFTFAPLFKLWFTQLEYSLKVPVKTTNDDVKVSTLHSLDFRLFF